MAGTVLAMARESNGMWTARQLEWEVRFCKLLLYQHAALRSLGAWTALPTPPPKDVADDDFDRLLRGDDDAWL